MSKHTLIMNGIILFYVIQRISEMTVSRTNENWLRLHHHAKEIDKRETLMMKLFHTFWFIALFIEANLKQDSQSPLSSLIIYFVLGLCLFVRLHSMGELKSFWTIKVLSLEQPEIATTGLYRYVRHPNYFIVIIEMVLIPLLFKAYWTMAIFSLVNLLVLSKRIQAEENSLMQHPDYKKHFSDKKRFIPFIFLLCLSTFSLKASEIVVHSNSYKEAKANEQYLKFQNTSTKFGFITTDFDGYAKEFKITYDLAGDRLSNLEVTLPIKSLDTDVGSRDEKMHTTIMDAEKYPNLTASFTGPVNLLEETQSIDMTFTIKDKKITRPVSFIVNKKTGKIQIKGTAQLGLKDMGLPDPSIAIAKVRDLFDIEFNVHLN